MEHSHPESIIDIVLPVRNEALSIEFTVREFYEEVAVRRGLSVRFVIVEDGSTDQTAKVLRRLQDKLPILLLTAKERRGYTQAVIEGLKATTADYVCFIDSDGQCDPRDFIRFWQTIRARSRGFDREAEVVFGHRNPRRHPWLRLALSAAFGAVYRRFFPVPLHDPSCPYMMIRRRALDRVLKGTLGLLPQAFWWEFSARACSLGIRLREIDINHRARETGIGRNLTLGDIPKLAVELISGMIALEEELSLPVFHTPLELLAEREKKIEESQSSSSSEAA